MCRNGESLGSGVQHNSSFTYQLCDPGKVTYLLCASIFLAIKLR